LRDAVQFEPRLFLRTFLPFSCHFEWRVLAYYESRAREGFSVITTGREYIDRLQACGMSESSATDICYKYAAQDDEKGLAELVRANELLYDDRREYV
jgi:hypothetical protein